MQIVERGEGKHHGTAWWPRFRSTASIDWPQAEARPEFTCRVGWKPGTLIIRDNRRTMHNAINDYHGTRRHMRRLTSGPTNPI